MSAAALPPGTEQLALVTALRQRSDNARTSRLGMPAVLLEHKREVLSDEFRTRDSTLASPESSRSSSGSRAMVVAFFLESAMEVI